MWQCRKIWYSRTGHRLQYNKAHALFMLENKGYRHVHRLCNMYLLLFYGKVITRTRLHGNVARILTALLMKYTDWCQYLTIKQPKQVWDESVYSSCDAVLPEEERQPADHEGAHYNAERAGSLVLCPPAGALLPHRRACNQRHNSALHLSAKNGVSNDKIINLVVWKVFERRWLCLKLSYSDICLGEEEGWGNRKTSVGLANVQVDKSPVYNSMVLQMARWRL
jgi:hypothetical protein